MDKRKLLENAVGVYKTKDFNELTLLAESKKVITSQIKDDGKAYQTEIDFRFEDKTKDSIRVSGLIDDLPGKWWKIFLPSTVHDFIMHKDGTIQN